MVTNPTTPMFDHLKLHVLPAAVALLLGASVAHADMGAIRDNADFFSTRAKTEALRNIGEIGRRFNKDLVVETFRVIPNDIKQGVDLNSKAAVSRLYEQWAEKQAKQQRVNGIYILLLQDPAHLQVLVGNETQRNAFTLKDRDALVTLMLAKLRNKQNDDALLEGVNYVNATMRSHLPDRGRAAAAARHVEAPGSSHWFLTIIVVALVVWVVLRIVGAIFAGGGGGGAYSGGQMAPGYGGGGGGGGFLTNMLGGMFGAAAGMWIYDQFSGRSSSSSSWGGGDFDNRADSGFSGQDSDYSGSGGDFGAEDSGGSGFGGGSDFGGGDSGGDDSSSGGGDF